MNLYNKYRPTTLEEVVGNHEVFDYLVGLEGKYPSAILLHGETGCGKTTIARIITTDVGCHPVDLQEINSANFRGIDSVRDMIKQAQFKPVGGSAKVWIIDEAHKMTGDAQNAMLKLLEDPPASSYFILCTTEPNKLIKTVRGRCQSLQVKPLDDDQMQKLLKRIVRAEEQRIDRSVYAQIIQSAEGLPRNAIQILERVLNSPVESQLKAAHFWEEERAQSIELCRALIKGEGWAKISSILTGLRDQDPEGIRRHLLGYCQAILLKGKNDRAFQICKELWEPLYNIGFPGLITCCYELSN